MRIAIITDGIVPYVLGGMQRHSRNLVINFSKLGVNVTLFHCVNDKVLPSEEEVNLSLFGKDVKKYIKVYSYYFPSSIRFPGHYFYNSKKYSNCIYKDIIEHVNEYDFIYAKGFTAWSLLKAKKNGKNIPNIGVNFHGYEMWQYAPSLKMKLKQYLFRPFVKWNNKYSDFIFSYGSKVTQIISSIGVSNQKIIEIPSGIEKTWLRNTPITINNMVRFLFIGRYERRKGIEEINIVLQKINFKNLNIEFHFIGPIPDSKKVKNLDNNVIYHGQIIEDDSIKSVIDCCDILICPSYSEGMPNVILEAMSRGLAVIATDVGANRQLVSNENGKLIKFDTGEILIESLQSSILELVSLEKSQLLRKKEASINKITDFTFDKIAEMHISFFKQFF